MPRAYEIELTEKQRDDLIGLAARHEFSVMPWRKRNEIAALNHFIDQIIDADELLPQPSRCSCPTDPECPEHGEPWTCEFDHENAPGVRFCPCEKCVESVSGHGRPSEDRGRGG